VAEPPDPEPRRGPAGSVLVEVLEDRLDTAGVGNLMATAAKVRGLAGMVIDGGARDVDEIEAIGNDRPRSRHLPDLLTRGPLGWGSLVGQHVLHFAIQFVRLLVEDRQVTRVAGVVAESAVEAS
jgi:hypothetical protein